ncbi:hypothetical protein [Clostridium sp.]|uniref:hypothetical protein n=1 Tax=Clostridium sp. TaxID=1506 RepID=UPI0039940F5B
MAQESSFFNAQLVNGAYDRVYNAENWAAYFATFLSNGVSINPSTCLQVQAGTGMNVIVAMGTAFINGYRYANTMPLEVSINMSNATYPRITSVILELNLNERNILIKTLDGAPSSTPVTPTLTRTTGIYQLQLATILVQAGATQITAGNITDTRADISVCGIIKGLFGENESIATIEEIEKLKEEIASLDNTYLTASSSPLLTNNWTFGYNNGLYFNSSSGTSIIGLQTQENNEFTMFNPVTNSCLFYLTPVTSGIDTIAWSCNNTFQDNVTITEGGNLYFQNESGKNILCSQVNGNEFSISNAQTGNNIATITPVTSGIDTVQCESNYSFNNNVDIAESSTVFFNNSNKEHIITAAVYTDTFELVNSITNNAFFSITPVNSGTDTLQVFSNIQMESNSNFQGTATFNNTVQVTDSGSLAFQNSKGKDIVYIQVDVGNGENNFVLQNAITNNGIFNITPVSNSNETDTVQMWANVNFSEGGALQVNGEQIWNGGNATSNPTVFTGQLPVSNSGGEYLTYNIQYWTMNMGGVVNATAPPQCGIGVITVELIPCSNNVDWSGSLSVALNGLAGINGLQTMMVNQNPEFTLALNAEIQTLLINNVNIVPNYNSNTPNTYTATAILLN